VPAMQSTTIPLSSRKRRTPMWAMPLAPPPLRTRPILGLLAVEADAGVSGAAEAGEAPGATKKARDRRRR